MRRSLFALAALAAAGCTLGTEPVAPRTVDGDYALGGGSFYPAGTRVSVAADAFEQAGKVAVCAAWAADGVSARAKPYLNTVLDIGVLQLGGRNVLQGFSGFPRAASRAALVGSPAGCVLTGHDWRGEYAAVEPEIEFGRLPLEREDEPAGGVSLAFRGD